MRIVLGSLVFLLSSLNVTLADSLHGVVAPQLISKALEIIQDCGSTIVSARAGRGYHSNHPIGRAVDISGNPGCIYNHLHQWPGGYSTDYNSAPGGKHVHISYNPGGQEWGLRFVHNHGYHSRYHSGYYRHKHTKKA